MRRLLSFECEGAALGGTLDEGASVVGLLMTTGGTQTRVGSHRMYERLAKALSDLEISCLRFDRRGVGDSDGLDPGFRHSGPDLEAAAAALRRERPGLERVYGFGLCDAASAIALFADSAGLDGLVLVNPWLVEAEAGAPPPAAIRHHYRQRLFSREGWKKLLSGSVDYRKLLSGVAKIVRREAPSGLAAEIAAALARHRRPAELILASGDATAIAAEKEMQAGSLQGVLAKAQRIASDSHTFARPGDEEALAAAVIEALRRLKRG